MNQDLKKDELHSTPTLRLEDIYEFTMERIKEVANMSELVKFHSVNKYLIMAYSPFQLNKLGNIVANHEKLKFNQVLEKYQEQLKQVFSVKPTTKSHFNTLQHILGHFSPDLSISERRYFLTMIQNFRNEKSQLGDILRMLKECTTKYDKAYLSRQTYFLFFTNPNDS